MVLLIKVDSATTDASSGHVDGLINRLVGVRLQCLQDVAADLLAARRVIHSKIANVITYARLSS